MLKTRIADLFPGSVVEVIHGDVEMEDRRTARIRFEHGSRFMVSTEAVWECINLQKACHLMVNYDLPWNPMRLQKRIGELLNRETQLIELDHARMAQEIAYLADRSDVSEEMVRLKSHLQQFREALSSTSETGKMLDFLLQELNREANTTLSKSTELSIKEAALGIKAEVEKLREQVQNVE